MGDDAQRDRHGHRRQDDARLGRVEGVHGQQTEDHRGQPARAEPADERDGGPVEPGSEQGDRDGDHAHDGERGQGEDDVAPVAPP